MKWVIIIGLISLSMSLSAPTDATAAATALTPNATNNHAEVATKDGPITPPIILGANNTETKINNITQNEPSINNTKTTTNQTLHNGDLNISNSTMQAPAPTVDSTPIPPKPQTKDNDTKTSSTTHTLPPVVTAASPTQKPSNREISTTPKPDKSQILSSTTAPKTTDAGDVKVQARSFDGPSFIGGIFLTLGMLAVGFIGFKYYKNKTERNYHTL